VRQGSRVSIVPILLAATCPYYSLTVEMFPISSTAVEPLVCYIQLDIIEECGQCASLAIRSNACATFQRRAP
jgi:hypothetical protein